MNKQNEILTEAIKALRKGLKQPMREFADTADISLRSVVRFEQGEIPRRSIIRRLAQLAEENGFVAYQAIFLSYLSANAPDLKERIESIAMLGTLFTQQVREVASLAGISKKAQNQIDDFTDATMLVIREEVKRVLEK